MTLMRGRQSPRSRRILSIMFEDMKFDMCWSCGLIAKRNSSMSASKRTLSGRTRDTHSVGSDPAGEASSKRHFEVILSNNSLFPQHAVESIEVLATTSWGYATRPFEVANCLQLNVGVEAFASSGRIHDTIPTGEWHLRRAQVDQFDVGNSGPIVRIAGTPIILS
jgi:hypothetical protein